LGLCCTEGWHISPYNHVAGLPTPWSIPRLELLLSLFLFVPL
jgi:hypothetical protein